VTSPRIPHVLVIEDDNDVAALLASHLHRLGCRVVVAGTGEAGLAAARGDRPDVVIVDVLLPGIDGREVVRTLRDEPQTSDCSYVVTSVLDRADLRAIGADAVLPKPFSRRDVARLLTSLDTLGGAA
jgi:CheY-like chemotaxis protein